MAREVCNLGIEGLSDQDMVSLKEEVSNIVKSAASDGKDPSVVLRKFFDDRTETIKMNKINRVMTAVKHEEVIEHITQDAFRNDPVAGLESLMITDVTKKYSSAGPNVEMRRSGVTNTASSIILQGLSDVDNGLKRMATGEYDLDIMKMWRGEKVDAPQDVRQMFETLKKTADYMFTRKKKAGFSINYLKDRIVKMSHPKQKLLDMGFDEWDNLARETFDFKKMDIEDVDLYLEKQYADMIKEKPRFNIADDFTSIKSNMVAKIKQRKRTIHYNDADAFNKYYSTIHDGKTLFQGTIDEIMSDSGHIAAAEVFGPNYKASFQKAANYAQQIDPKKYAKNATRLDNLFNLSTSNGMHLGNSIAAKYGDKVRKLTNMRFLSTSVLSTIPDVAYGAGIISSATGQNMIGATAELLHTAMKLVPREQRKLVGAQIQVFAEDAVTGYQLRRFGDTSTNMTSALDKIHHLSMVATGLPDQSHIMRQAIAKLLSTDLHSKIGEDYGSLFKGTKSMLDKFGIDEDHWKIAQLGADDYADGNFGITPEAISRLSDEDIQKAFPDLRSKAKISEMRNRTAIGVQSYYNYLAGRGSPTPGIRANRWKMVMDPNTVIGQVAQFAGQFKSFSMSVIETMQAINRIGAEDSDIRKFQFGNMGNTAGTVVASTIGGYVALAAQDMIKGRSQKDPKSLDTWKKSFLKGGSGSLYADFALADRGYGKNNVTSDILGPAFSVASDLESTIKNPSKKGILKSAERNSPIGALPLVGPMLNYYMFNGIYSFLNKGRTAKQRKYLDKK